MCGIAGITGESFDKNLIPVMLESMKHRGPDAKGFYLSRDIHLGHCRLSINDLSECANQPFVSKEHSISVVVNGEIYNFSELKSPLQEKGYKFQSNSDSEVVLHAYIEQGLNFITKLNGMFAICIWDGRKKELFLIRDRLGIKPLYYASTKELFVFASEIKALVLCNEIELSLDMQSFAEYLAFENYFSNRTLNKKIKIVEPGEIVKFQLRDKSIERKYFWQPHLSDLKYNDNGLLYENYLNIIESSVNRHLISDVPLGCYLSAGIDSSSVAYWSSKKIGSELKTYTGFFGKSGFYDEATDAAKTAQILGCTNKKVEIKPEDFTANIEKIIWHLDEPRVGIGAFSQYMVVKKAAEEVKVILTGHGGDELFAGYPVFKAIYGKQNIPGLVLNSSLRELMFAAYFSIFPKIRKEVGYFLPNIFSLNSFKEILDPDFYQTVIHESNLFQELETLKNRSRDEYEQLTLVYLKHYLPALFIVEDKISMAFSLESRTPLCDNEMLDFALSIPLPQKLTGYELKHIPRKAMKGKLPSFIYNLPKRGFPTPLVYWFKKELKEYVRNFIFDNIDSANIFNKKGVERIVLRYQNSKVTTPFDEIEVHKIWVILNIIFYFKFQKQRYKL